MLLYVDEIGEKSNAVRLRAGGRPLWLGEKCKCCNSADRAMENEKERATQVMGVCESRRMRLEMVNAFACHCNRWVFLCVIQYYMKNESWKRMFSHLLTRVNKETLLSNWTSNIHKRLYGTVADAAEWAIGFKPTRHHSFHLSLSLSLRACVCRVNFA